MCLYSWDYTTTHNENEDENKKQITKIWKKKIDLDLDMDRNIVNIECLSIMMVMCIKQNLSNIWSLIHEKVEQHWS